MNRQTATICTAVLTLAMVATADARVVRRGGGGARVAPAIGGTSTYLLPVGVYSAGDVVSETEVQSLPRYSFSDVGSPIQAHHNWGAACSENRQVPGTPDGNFYDCFFLLGLDETLDLGGHIIGLPDPMEYTDNTPIPTLNYTWTLTAGTQEYVFDQTNPLTPLGATLPRNAEDPDGFDETCFARFFGYTRGICQLLDFDSGALTGAELLAASGGGDIFLDLSVELLAPSGFEFINIWDYDSGFDDLFGTVVDDGFAPLDRLQASAERMPIRVDVPVPSTFLLFAAGAMLLMRRRRHTQHP